MKVVKVARVRELHAHERVVEVGGGGRLCGGQVGWCAVCGVAWRGAAGACSGCVVMLCPTQNAGSIPQQQCSLNIRHRLLFSMEPNGRRCGWRNMGEAKAAIDAQPRQEGG